MIELTQKANEFIENDAGFVTPLSIFIKGKVDILRIPLDVNLYISEDLKNRFLEEKVTGMKVVEPKVKFLLSAQV